MSILARFLAAARDPAAIAREHRAAGRRVVWTLGWDIPRELIDAHGLAPVRLAPGDHDRSATDALVGRETMGERGRALLAAIAAIPDGDALLISHADSEQVQIFSTLRELDRSGALRAPPAAFLDLLTIDREPTRRYNRRRLEQVQAWLTGIGGPANLDLAKGNAIRAGLSGMRPMLTGTEAHQLVAAAAIVSAEELLDGLPQLGRELSERVLPARPRIFLSGAEIEDVTIIEGIERDHGLIVGSDHGWGDGRLAPLHDLATATLSPRSGPFSPVRVRTAHLIAAIAQLRPDRVVHYAPLASEHAPWEAAEIRRAAGRIPVVLLPEPAVAQQRDAEAKPAATPVSLPSARPKRSRKSLAVLGRFGAYQREWFASVRAAAETQPIAVVNANAPQEMLRALDMPFVVNQWWASIVAAKQHSARYRSLLVQAGLPDQVDAYSSQGVAAALEDEPDDAPWGGLPRPSLLGVVSSNDSASKMFDIWAGRTGARLQLFQRTVDCRWDLPIDWWDGLAEDWERYIEPERLDLFEAELSIAIADLEQITGRVFDAARLEQVMTLVNEQEEYYRKTRNLIARTVPAPISVVDQMPATMVPQWHRGTEWARDAARDFHAEVAERAARGEAAYPGERIRLMFVGRGVWSDMGFYQRWEESHGAVFVCSMYLSLAADGYIRSHSGGRDPLRALAARFVTMGDELRMPTWAGAWNVKEALLHQVDGAMALSDADPLVLRALREAGIPLLELEMDNYVPDPQVESDLDRRVIAFLEGPAAQASERRRNMSPAQGQRLR